MLDGSPFCVVGGGVSGSARLRWQIPAVRRDVYQQGKQVTLEVQVGNNAAPVAGNPKFTGEFYVDSYVPVTETGKAIQFVARLRPATGTAPTWGTV